MASQNVWSDFDVRLFSDPFSDRAHLSGRWPTQALRHNVKSNTVERLKQILTGFNEECYTNCTKSGKKQDLIDRITHEMDAWRNNNNVERWVKGRAIINQVRTTGWCVDATLSYAPLDALALGCSTLCTPLLTRTIFV